MNNKVKSVIGGVVLGALVVGGLGLDKVAEQQRKIEGLYADISNMNVDIGNMMSLEMKLVEIVVSHDYDIKSLQGKTK